MAGVQAGNAGRLSIEIVAEIARLQQDLDRAKRAVKAASDDIAKSARAANDNLAGIGRGASAMGQSTRLAGHHVQNLTFQLNDMIVGLASGQKPMTVFMQQGMQIGQIMQMAGLGVAGFVKELALLAAPFAPILAALGLMAGALALVTSEINENSKVQVSWKDTALGAYDAVVAYVKGQLNDAFKSFGTTSGEVFKYALDVAKAAFNGIIGAGTLAPRLLIAAWGTFPAAVGEATVGAANMAIRAMNTLVRAGVEVANGFAAKINSILAVINAATGASFGLIPTLSAPQMAEVANQYAGAGAKFGEAMLGALKDTVRRDFIGEMADAIQPFAVKRAMDDAGKKTGKAAKGPMGKAGKEAGEAFTDAMMEQVRKGFEAALGQSMENVSALLKANENVDYAEMLKAANDNLDKVQKPLKEAADKQAEWNDRLQETVGWLKQIGGVGGTLGAVLGAFAGLTSGDFSAVGGRAGAMLQQIAGIQWKDDSGNIHKLGEEFHNALTGVFGDNFGEKMLGAFTGAGMGLGIGAVLGGGNKMAQLGGAIGGAAGQAIGSSIAALGSAGGPIGSVVGAIAGTLLGGLLKKAKTGSATIGVSNGELGIGGVRGNSSSRRTASTQGANSVIDALNTIAEAFGASLGTANVSIGMRDNSYRVDTTGQGRTKGAGVINFGKDSEAALKAAIADAISDGVFVGLSAGVERLLKNGDVEKQLQKALSFQAVFDDLAAAKDPAQAAQDAITKWHDSMAKIFAEAGATAEELAKLEELTGIKRAEAAKQSAEQIVEDLRPYREAEIQIMQLEGKTAEALAAQRALETEGMTDGLKALYTRIYALQDEAEATAKAAEIAATRKELETQLLEVTDPVAAALVRHNDALEALDPSLRDLYQQLVDARAAADAAAEAEKLLAEQRDKAANDATTRVDQLRALTIRYAKALGQDAAALELERADALRDLDPSLRDFMKVIWGIEDATEATTKAAADLKTAAEEAQKLADQRRSLQIQLADILNPAEAEAMRRADTLAALTDPISRSYQEQIYAALDLKAAQEAAAKAEQDRADLEEARLAAIVATRNDLIQAYERESRVLEGTIDKFNGFADAIRQFRDGLTGSSSVAGFGMLRDRFRSTSSMARFGDEAALGRFTGDAQAYLDAARDRVGSGTEYRRILAEVLGGSNGAINGATGVASMAQQQLEQMKAQVGELVGVNENTETLVSVSQALAAYQAALAAEIPAQNETLTTGMETVAAAVTTQTAQLATTSANQQAALDAMALALVRLERKFDTTFQDGALRITSDETLSVTVANTSANPVPVDTTP